MDQPQKAEQHKTKVFISYSRVDGAFAEKLRAALAARGFEAYLDKADILPGEPWRARIEGLILAADAIVFVMSPSSIASEICTWEVQRALELKKSVTPLHWCIVPNDAVPESLSERNYVFFDAYERSGMKDEVAFDASLAKLEMALKVSDILWVREHTKWVARAVEWQQAEPARPEGKLLRAADIAAVQGWARLKPATAPDMPSVLVDYLAASVAKEEYDAKRLRQTTGRAFVKPAVEALKEGLNEHALRLAAAGALLADDLDFVLVPELWNIAIRAILRCRTSAVLKGHTGRVGIAAFSPDGRLIVTASSDHTARVWNADTGQEIVCLHAHNQRVNSAAFSPDGRKIVSASSDHTARVWDVDSGTEGLCLSGHELSVNHAVFSPDSRRIVTASSDNTARMWDATRGEEIGALRGHSNSVLTAAFSPDGRRIVTTSIDTTGRVWDADTGKQIVILRGHESQVVSAAFSPDGRRIVTASFDTTARVWDAALGEEIGRLKGHKQRLVGAEFSPDGSRILTASFDSTARVWDAETARESTLLKGHDQKVISAAFSPEGRRVATASDDNTVRMWDAESGKEIVCLKAHERPINTVSFSPDGRQIVTASEDTTARIWNVASPEMAFLKDHGPVYNAAFSSDGSRLVTSSDCAAVVWDAETGKRLAELLGHDGNVIWAAFSLNGRRIVTNSSDKTVRVWNADTGRETGCVRVPFTFAFGPDSRRFVAGRDEDNTAWIGDAETGAEIALLKGHDRRVVSAAFNPQGCWVATASDDHTARVWDAKSGEERICLKAHDAGVKSVSFSPDGRRIVTASYDQTARVWDVESGNDIIVLNPSEDGGMDSASFSPDGRRIVTVGNRARLWDAERGIEISLFNPGVLVDTKNAAIFSPDSRFFVTYDLNNRKMRVRTTANGAEVFTFRSNDDCAVFSPDGSRTVIASASDNAVRVWDVSRAKTAACEPAIAVTAGLARGIGWRTNGEAVDILMQGAPEDMFGEATARLGDRARDIDEALSALSAAALSF
jgi:WD40 repeat protein